MRVADLLLSLSRFADLGFGLEMGTSLRSCVIATRFARSLNLPTPDVRTAYYTALLHHVGCVGHASETAQLFGDELAANAAAGRTDAGSTGDFFGTFLPTLTEGKSTRERARLTMSAVTKGGRWGTELTTTTCEVGRDSARRLRLDDGVQAGLFHVYDLWAPPRRSQETSGDEIPVGARIARLTGLAAMFASIAGPDAATQALRRRAGGMLDPELVDRFTERATDWFGQLAAADGATALDEEPTPHETVTDLRLVAEVFGDLADLKSPYLVGHSRDVAALASGAAMQLGLAEAERSDLVAAGHLHDVGRVAVSNAVWDTPGPLGADDWEHVRLHPYHSERILSASGELSRLAPLVGRHHERLDGSGYHRGAAARDLSTSARVLAVADAYQTWIEPRPHRAALTSEQARRRLLDDVGRGVLDADAVDAVLATAGLSVPQTHRQNPSGLSDREVEVLRLVARGCSNAEIAAHLVISRRTAEHHVQHVYSKIGTSSRAAATLFALDHDLAGANR